MTDTITSHLNFRGDAREALAFYRTVFDGEVTIYTYADIHQVDDPTQADAVAFGQLTTPDGLRLLAYDVQTTKPYDRGQNSFYLELHGDEQATTQQHWDRLAEAGTVLTPIGPSPFAPLYGMLTDRWGVTWIISAS